MKSLKVLLKAARNVLSIPVGLIAYAIMETLTASIFYLLLKIPLLSLLMTGFIPKDIFFSASVATISAFTATFVVKLISVYKSTNYSIVIVFLILLLKCTISTIINLLSVGFNFVYLSSALIHIGTYIFGCFMATEKET